MDTRKQMNQFIEAASNLNIQGITDLVGVNINSFNKWISGYPNSLVESRIRLFLAEEGAILLEITEKLKTSRKDRIALHQERAEIFKKARIHTTANQRVPSLNNSTI